MASRAKLSCFLLGILFFSLVTLLDVDLGAASTLPKVFVDPPETKDPSKIIGSTFTVNVNISNVENLYGWQVNMTFNPVVLNTTSALMKEGPFLKQAGPTYLIARRVNNTAGAILMGCMLKTPYPPSGAFGSGTLFNITFTVRASERGTLMQFVTGTKLNSIVSGNLVPIEHTTEDGIFDNRISNVPPVASFSFAPSAANVGDLVRFDATASFDPDAWLVIYRWDYGDGKTEIYTRELLQNINLTAKTTHTYSQPGIFNVILEVTDNDGASDTVTAAFTVGYDVAVTGIRSSHMAVIPGTVESINVTLANLSQISTGTFNVTLYGNETIIGLQELTGMAPTEETILIFPWNTTGLGYGKYILKANTTVMQGDYNASNNEYRGGTLAIALANVVDYPTIVGGFTFHVIVQSTSSATNFQFIKTEKKMSLDLDEQADTGFANVTVPMDLLGGPYSVLLDGLLQIPLETANGTHEFLYFSYARGTHTSEIIGQTVATPPTAIFITSTARTFAGNPITFNATNSYDPDGTIESYSWVFGVGEIANGKIVEHAFTVAGDYTVTLTVIDDKHLSNSTHATITVTVPVHNVAVTALAATPNTVKVGEQISILITVANKGNLSETFDVTAYYSNTIIKSKTVTSLTAGDSETITIEWNTTDVNPDTYSLKAVAAAVAGETEKDDNTLIIEDIVSIQKLNSQLSISTSAATLTQGETATIAGTITPIRAGVTITVYLRLTGETWSALTTVTTDSQGHYEYAWKPDKAGTYEVKVGWQGDSNTQSNESLTQTVTVHEPSNAIWLYASAALIIIALMGATIYLVKIRKHK